MNDKLKTPAEAQTGQTLAAAPCSALLPCPCPFCGGAAEVEVLLPNQEHTKWRKWVSCQTPACHADGPIRETRVEAITAWNRRTPNEKGQ